MPWFTVGMMDVVTCSHAHCCDHRHERWTHHQSQQHQHIAFKLIRKVQEECSSENDILWTHCSNALEPAGSSISTNNSVQARQTWTFCTLLYSLLPCPVFIFYLTFEVILLYFITIIVIEINWAGVIKIHTLTVDKNVCPIQYLHIWCMQQ